jgi:demethylmenaquinone methyltransferase/2-methoxy-6-polyprenyl-1,4-benzoquinol methylase
MTITDKSQHRIRNMFNRIAKRYDLMNDIMTGLRHRSTRKKAAALLNYKIGQKALDVATGTGDFAFELFEKSFGRNLVVGVDISAKMLKIANYRAKQKNLQGKICFHLADINNLPFKDGSFHVCTLGYGIRNVSDPITTLKEIARVTKKGGKILIVEATPPPNRIIRLLYLFYFNNIVPVVARILVSDGDAYYYLGKSISQFPVAPRFVKMIQRSNWREANFYPILLGMVTIFIAKK